MYCTKKITSDLIWLGGSDRRLALFENVYPIPRGVSYNAYLIQDEKTALLDTVDQAIAERFFENLEHALQGKPLNYVIVNHMEPDHAATLGDGPEPLPGGHRHRQRQDPAHDQASSSPWRWRAAFRR